ncbi:MAG: dihydrolipoamide acetyltransferase family protein [Gemmatimonadales bacterium]|jgi:pyruvate dehydrogenase E2 component (dihydrolipoamide acetyltransferase)
MATKVYMEALSPTMEEGRIVSWLKREGDSVTDGDVIAEVETDKAIMELQARGEGTLRKVFSETGATVEVGTLIGVIAAEDEDIASILEKAAVVDETQATGAEPRAAGARPSVEPTTAEHDQRPSLLGGDRVKSSPLARRLAKERQIDLRVVQGSGPGGRITRRDVEAAVPGARHIVTAAGPSYEDKPITQIRKTIATRLSTSIGPVPHFFLTAEIDMERTAEARDALNSIKDAPRVSFNDIIVKVVAEALRQHPECNAWWQDDYIRYFSEVHISMAVSVEEGLITPVIRNAHLKSLREIAAEGRELAQKARERKLKPEEYSGGTFSISNLGMFDIDQFTAVINPPEAGILAVGSISDRPVVIDGDLQVRKRLRVTMSCDHRVIDGATGARFLQTLRRMLENPLALVW